MILGLGGVVIDRSLIVPDIPGWDTVLHAHHYSTHQGGMVATALAACARLGVQSEFIGAIGDDDAGGFIVKKFIENHVSCARIVVKEGEPSPCSICLVNEKSGARTIIHYRGLQDQNSLNIDINLAEKKFLHLDGYWPETAVTTAKKAKEEGIVVTLDPSSTLIGSPYCDSLLDLVDYVVPGYNFASGLTGKSDVREMCTSIYRPTMKAVVVTWGNKGVFTYDGELFVNYPGFDVDVVDTTGAGDVFHGALLVGLSRGYTLEQNCRLGNAAAALKCRSVGGQGGIPTQAEVSEFLNDHGYSFFTVME
ncbi:MAG: PfkB family carbohydrate kinase [Spirochaetes bacterium]|jgi:sulfofructose kinase|nr:PfkB family carbohydrate kinase [Spirochaetota bacterium]